MGNIMTFGGTPAVDRFPTAGSLSVSEGESGSLNEAAREEYIAADVFLEIVDGLKYLFHDTGIELNFTNDEMHHNEEYQYAVEKTKNLFNDWQARKLDKRQIVPGLQQTLGVNLAENRANWIVSCYHENQPTPQDRYQALRGASDRVPMQLKGVHEIKRTVSLNMNAELVEQRIRTMYVLDQTLRKEVVDSVKQQTAALETQTPPVNQAVNGNEVVPNELLLPEYNMNKRPRGMCVIINNREFNVAKGDKEAVGMPPRIGTDKDAELLRHVFTKFEFIINRRDNLTDTEIMRTLLDVSFNVDHSQFDCLVVCVLTHGVQNYVYGSNGRLVSIKDITSTFQANRCPKLGGKPKLFFFQACQGRNKMEGNDIESDSTAVPPRTDDPVQENQSSIEVDAGGNEMIPNEADFLIGYATMPGYASFRSRNLGSWYIRKLCELLEKHSSRHDLLSILVEVNREVSHANAYIDGGIFKQTPAPLVTLRKKLYFR